MNRRAQEKETEWAPRDWGAKLRKGLRAGIVVVLVLENLRALLRSYARKSPHREIAMIETAAEPNRGRGRRRVRGRLILRPFGTIASLTPRR